MPAGRAKGASQSPRDVRARILLFSDLQLDRPYLWASARVAEARRAEAQQALVDLLALARKNQVDAIASAGNLFDRHTVRPATLQWLTAALRSAVVPVLIAPGREDYLGPRGGYALYDWPANVTVFDDAAFVPVEVESGVRIWGAAHTEAHRQRSFLQGVRVQEPGVNMALFHGSEFEGQQREPGRDPCALFSDNDVQGTGFDHALVGHYYQSHFGPAHTYPGAPLAHEFGGAPAGGAVIVSVNADGSFTRELMPVASTELHAVDVDLSGVKTQRDALRRVKAAMPETPGCIRVRLVGTIPADLVVGLAQIASVPKGASDVAIESNVEVDFVDGAADEASVRGAFIRDVVSSRGLSDDQCQRVLRLGLRALSGHTELAD